MAEQPKIVVKPKPKATPAELENLFEFPQPPEDELEEGSINQLLTDISASDTAEVKVYRILVNNKLAWIYDIHPSEFKMSDLRDVYEGGNFLLRIYGIEDGRKILRAAPRISVEPPKRKNSEVLPVQQNQGSDVAQAMAAAMQGLGTMMVQGFENLGKLIVQNRPEPIDPMTMQNNFLQQMVVMKQLFDKPAPVEQTGLVEKSLDMLQRGIEMGKSMGEVRGESSSTDVLLETVKSLGPAIMAGIQSQPQRQQLPPQVTQQFQQHIPQPIQQSQLQPQHNQEENDVNFIQKQRLKMGLGFLVDAAERNLHVETYAEIALDTLSDEELESIIENPSIIDAFIEIEPRINQHREWFGQLLSTMQSLLTDDSEDGTNGEPQLVTIEQDALITHPAQPAEDTTSSDS